MRFFRRLWIRFLRKRLNQVAVRKVKIIKRLDKRSDRLQHWLDDALADS